MTLDRERLIELDRSVVWHAFTQMAEYEPLIIERADGCVLVDIDGREYIDGVSSLWCNIHGHRHPRLDEAVRRQLDRVAHVTSLGCSNPTTIELAARLVKIAPAGLNHVFFSDDGATAVEVALKMAFQYWRQCSRPRPEKTCYVALGDAYHGDTLGAVSVGGVERFHAMFEPLLFPSLRLPAPKAGPGACLATAEEVCRGHLDRLEKLFAEHHHRIAAMIIEPLMQCAAGMVRHPPGYLRGVRELTRQYEILLIADEVAVGFGRTGKMFACEHENVAPDLMCLAKGITAGYLPLAATLTSDEVYSAFLGRYEESKTFFHGHTYGGNPLGAAVALANLDLFESEQMLAKIQPRIAQLTDRLMGVERLKHVGSVRQCGLIAGVELMLDPAAGIPFPWEQRVGGRVCDAVRRHGVWLRPLGNVIVIMPPLCISADQLDRVVDAIEVGISETIHQM